jgi:hypothetical protein
MRRSDLVPDCGSCAAICCVATSFEASEDFAFDKPAGVHCRHLTRDCRCAVHDDLARRGLPGCAVYDCYGAGQRMTRAFSVRGQSSLADTANDAERNEAFLILRVVHELLWQLTEAAKLCPATRGDVGATLALEIDALDAIARAPWSDLFDVDLGPHRDAARRLLCRVGDALGGRRAVRSLVVLD